MGRTRIRGVVVVAFALAVLFVWDPALRTASTQSLAEVARKERDRRARIEGERERIPVIGSEELEASGGTSRSITGKEPGSGAPAESAAPPPTATEPVEAESHLTDNEARELRETWARVWRERMEQAQAELDRARDDAYQCRSAGRYFFVPLAIDCEGVEERLAEANARLRQVKQQRYDWQLLLPDGREKGTP